MYNSSENPWSDAPNAPRIPYTLYLEEKSTLAGVFLGAILCGIIIVLFLQCVGALLNPVDGGMRAIKWGLVAHTTAMFMLAAMCSAFYIDFQRITYIDNRAFPGSDGVIPPGPSGYGWLAFSDAISIIPYFTFLLNQWLADGFLLYRCYVVYSKNYWAIIFPGLMYLASIAMGITLTYNAASKPDTVAISFFSNRITLSYLMLSLLLNVLLTLMIVARLFIHSRDGRNAMGASANASGLYKSIITILIESCALYAGIYLVYIVTSALKGNGQHISGVFQPILAATQVIAPFLVIRRVANRSAVTSNMMASGDPDSFRFRSQGESTGDDETIPDENPISFIEMSGEAPGEPGVVVKNAIEEVPLEEFSHT